MAQFAFYLLYVLSWLPLWFLYAASTLLSLIAHYLVRYRLSVVEQNIAMSFPEKSRKERQRIIRGYYRHMGDLLMEALYNLRATPDQIKRHYHIVNREILDRIYEHGQSAVLISSHYNNWEYMVAGLNILFLHHGIGVGKPLQDKRFGKLLTRQRTRYGTEVVDQTNVRETIAYYEQHHVPCAYMLLSDQCPSNSYKSYWTTFLHQETPFLYGAEYFARKYALPVVYYEVHKVHRGQYDVVFELLSENGAAEEPYAIEQRYVDRLEKLLQSKPDYWLWSHRRWKRSRPAEVPIHTPLSQTI